MWDELFIQKRDRYKLILGARECIDYMQDTPLIKIVDNEVGAAMDFSDLRSRDIEIKILYAWKRYLLGNPESKKNRLYNISKILYKKRYDNEKHDSDEKSKIIGNIYTDIKKLLKVDFDEPYKPLIELISIYINKKGILGNVGEKCIEQEETIDDDVKKLVEQIDCDIIIHELCSEQKILKWNNISKRKAKRISFISTLLNQIKRDKEFEKRYIEITSKINLNKNNENFSVNLCLGLDELQFVFVDPEFLLLLEKDETIRNNLEIKFRGEEEIADFLYLYYEIRSQKIMNNQSSKTNRGLEKNVKNSRISQEMLDNLLRLVLFKNHTDEEGEEQAWEFFMEQSFMRYHDWLDKQEGRCDELFFNIDKLFFLLEDFIWNCKPLNEFYTFVRIQVSALLADWNFYDMFYLLSKINSDEIGNRIANKALDIYSMVNHEVVFCFEARKNFKLDNIFETYALALSRKIEIKKWTKIKCIWGIWGTIFINYFMINQERCLSKDIREMSDEEIGKVLQGKRDTRIREKLELINTVCEWFNKRGFIELNPYDLVDVKCVYDIIYDKHEYGKQIRYKDLLKEQNVDIDFNKLKKVNKDSKYTKDEEAYLLCGIYLSYFYNKNILSKEVFIRLFYCVDTMIEENINSYYLVNYDYIIIVLNGIRKKWSLIMKEV